MAKPEVKIHAYPPDGVGDFCPDDCYGWGDVALGDGFSRGLAKKLSKTKSGADKISREQYERMYSENPNIPRIPYEKLNTRQDLENALDGFFGDAKASFSKGSGVSMEPTFGQDARIITENPKNQGGREAVYQNLKKGDLVMTLTHETNYDRQYTGNMVPQVHRVHEVVKNQQGKTTAIITKGDNPVTNANPDRFPVMSTTSPSSQGSPNQYFIGKVVHASSGTMIAK